MAEYIEREAFKSKYLCCGYLPEMSEEEFDRFPAVDAVAVTRCKGCKHREWVQEPCHGKSVDYCKVWDCTLRNLEATFCSYGEPKAENNG